MEKPETGLIIKGSSPQESQPMVICVFINTPKIFKTLILITKNSVDLKHCGFTAPPSRVDTWMTCDSNCWTANGSDKIYDLSKDGFRVYLNNYGRQAAKDSDSLKADFAIQKNFELRYDVRGICNQFWNILPWYKLHSFLNYCSMIKINKASTAFATISYVHGFWDFFWWICTDIRNIKRLSRLLWVGWYEGYCGLWLDIISYSLYIEKRWLNRSNRGLYLNGK